jgi:hypothetical protein
VEVFENEKRKVADQLEDLVSERPGITYKEAAETLDRDLKYIRERARKLGIVTKSGPASKKGGRPVAKMYPATGRNSTSVHGKPHGKPLENHSRTGKTPRKTYREN